MPIDTKEVPQLDALSLQNTPVSSVPATHQMFRTHHQYSQPGLNWRPPACWAGVMTTRPWLLVTTLADSGFFSGALKTRFAICCDSHFSLLRYRSTHFSMGYPEVQHSVNPLQPR
eukprot:3884089-Amphidinium_carterae.1